MAEERKTDEFYMQAAIKEALIALSADEVPVGAVVVCKNSIIGRGYNMTERLNDVTAHAEMIAYTAAASWLNSKYLYDCTLYVTLEPCIMCAGASYWTQIPRIVFGAGDDKRGFLRYGIQLLHPTTKLVSGVLENECSAIIKDYFKSKRPGAQGPG